MMRRILRSLRADKGMALPTVIVGCVLMMITTGAAMYGIASFINVQKSATEASARVSAFQSTNALWKLTVANAEAIKVTDAKTIDFTVLESGVCRVDRWAIVEAGSSTSLDLTTRRYATHSTSPVKCTGTPQEETATLARDLRPGAHFAYKNAGTRDLAFTNGVATLMPETKPASVGQRDWDSKVPVTFTLNGAIADGPVNLTQDVTDASASTWLTQQGTGSVQTGAKPEYRVTPSSTAGAIVRIQAAEPLTVYKDQEFTAAVMVTAPESTPIRLSLQSATGQKILCDGATCETAATAASGKTTITIKGKISANAQAHLVLSTGNKNAFTIQRAALVTGLDSKLNFDSIDRYAKRALVFDAPQDAIRSIHELGAADGGSSFTKPE